jgi:hypothetical protein
MYQPTIQPTDLLTYYLPNYLRIQLSINQPSALGSLSPHACVCHGISTCRSPRAVRHEHLPSAPSTPSALSSSPCHDTFTCQQPFVRLQLVPAIICALSVPAISFCLAISTCQRSCPRQQHLPAALARTPAFYISPCHAYITRLQPLVLL